MTEYDVSLLLNQSKTSETFLFIIQKLCLFSTLINILLKFVKPFLIMWFLKFNLIIYYALTYRNSYY